MYTQKKRSVHCIRIHLQIRSWSFVLEVSRSRSIFIMQRARIGHTKLPRSVVHKRQSGRFPCPSSSPFLILFAYFWQKTRYPKRRVLIFSRLPRLDLAGDSTPTSTVSTFPNSRVVEGRNVGIGKGNVRPRVYISILCILAASQTYTHSLYCPPRVSRARAHMPGNALRPSRYLCHAFAKY